MEGLRKATQPATMRNEGGSLNGAQSTAILINRAILLFLHTLFIGLSLTISPCVVLGSNPLHVPSDPDTMSTQSFAELSSISLEKYDILVVKQHFGKVR